ncbi:hypothetical protein H072_9834 [Dactylellina haptotyla CBS 200.50]|uniref:Uncharacterized protein n=1 Tax=Dactylellina haptotyla (strain CBS 200.50) TaxID=1284197 RepID=S8BMX7_DACHA|nr:hypothetical protein H072_9834 [Dactylellina haptotyla CBS 200.50]
MQQPPVPPPPPPAVTRLFPVTVIEKRGEDWQTMHTSLGSYLDNDTWFRLYVKTSTDRTTPRGRVLHHHWYDINGFTTWNASGHKSMLCFGISAKVLNQMVISLDTDEEDTSNLRRDPYCFFQFLIDNLIPEVEQNYWHIGLAYIPLRQTATSGYPQLCANFSERCTSTQYIDESAGALADHIMIVERIIQRHQLWVDAQKFPSTDLKLAFSQVSDMLDFHLSALKGCKTSIDLLVKEAEKHTELATNIFIRSLHWQFGIFLKFIVILLPALMVSSIFSTNFFSSSSHSWSVADKFWVYWVTMVPIVLGTIIWVYYGWFVIDKWRMSVEHLNTNKIKLKVMLASGWRNVVRTFSR